MADLTIQRPKLTTINDYDLVILPRNPVQEVDNRLIFRVYLDNLTSTPQILSCTFNSGSDTLTFTIPSGKSISDLVRLGDTISGASSPFIANTYITNIAVANSVATITVNNDASTSGTANLTFTSPVIDSTIYQIEITHATSGSNLVVTPRMYIYDGTAVFDQNRDGEDDASLNQAKQTINLTSQSINIDTFLLNARIQRTNV